LSFFFTLFGALELAGEEIIHNQGGDKSSDAKVLLRIVVEHAELQLVTAFDQPGQELVDPEFLFVRPLSD
jgi:hypothetical protein